MITNNNTIGSHHNTATTVAVVTSSETPTASAPAAGVAAAASTSTLIKRHDVLCGRGKGIPHSHVGNKNYRRLIHENSNLYTKCHANDKKKITRGIVTAVRNAGGRFISYDRRRNTVSDIGDEKAFVKTSQAIRDKINKKEDEATFPFNTSSNVDWHQELPQKWYTDYSWQLLKSINSSNAVTAGDAPQNERVVLVQNHQEVPAYTSTPALSNPFHQGHGARDAHQYQPLPERLTSGSSHFSFGSFLDGCFEDDALPLDNHHVPPAISGEGFDPVDADGVCNVLICDENRFISDDEA